jgi:hypothetical protein
MLVIGFGTLDFGEKERKAIVDLVSEDEHQLTVDKRAMFIFWASLENCFLFC